MANKKISELTELTEPMQSDVLAIVNSNETKKITVENMKSYVKPSEATTTEAGLLSATDKVKLDGIEEGAEVNKVNSVNGQTGDVLIGLDLIDNYNVPVLTKDTAGIYLNLQSNLSEYKTNQRVLIKVPSNYVVTSGGTTGFITVGDNGSCYFSTDGETWNAMSTTGLDTSITYYSICYGNGRLVVVGDNGQSYYSTDGLTWTAMTGLSSGREFRSVCYNNGIFVCGGYARIAYSTDGLTWTESSSVYTSSNYCRGICYGGDRFVSVGTNGKSYYSLDGINWTAMTGLPSSKSFFAVAYGNDKYVTVGSGGESYYSTDGLTWTACSPDLRSSAGYYAVAYGDGNSINGGNGCFVTIDGTNKQGYWGGAGWSTTTSISSAGYINCITYANDKFIAVGADGRAFYSPNGNNWYAMTGLDTSKAYRGVTYLPVGGDLLTYLNINELGNKQINGELEANTKYELIYNGTNFDTVNLDETSDSGSSEGGTTDYTALSNKPTINDVELTGNKTSANLGLASATHTHTQADITDLTVPTKTSDLTNDSNYISSTVVTAFWSGTQAEYEALGTYNDTTLYLIKEG